MSVSPDGRFLLFPLNNRTQLVARDLTTGAERVLLRDDASIHVQPLMSPDGKRIVYFSAAMPPMRRPIFAS